MSNIYAPCFNRIEFAVIPSHIKLLCFEKCKLDPFSFEDVLLKNDVNPEKRFKWPCPKAWHLHSFFIRTIL